jgi:hypothetical protein
LRARARRAFQGIVRHESIHEGAVQGFGRPPQRLELDGAAFFRGLKGDDTRRPHAKPARELDAAHAQGVAERPNPALRGRPKAIDGLQRGEAAVEALAGAPAFTTFHSGA